MKHTHTSYLVTTVTALMLGFLFSQAAFAQNPASPSLEYELQTYAPNLHYAAIQLVDMDGNGRPEVVIGNRATSHIEIWDYDPDNHALTRVDSVQMPWHVTDVKIADFDHNGNLDIVAGVRGNGVRVALDSGPTTTEFWPRSWAVSFVDGRYTWQVIVEDFDKDGHLDVFDGIDGDYIKMFYGFGNGTFYQGPAPVKPPQAYSPGRGFNAFDLDKDGRLDLIGVESGHPLHHLRAYLNQSTPGFPAWSANIGPATPVDVEGEQVWGETWPTAGDLNGDGYIDQVAIMNQFSGPIPTSSDIVIMEGGDSGGQLVWTRRTLGTIPKAAQYVGIADFNDDGNLDVYASGYGWSNDITVYLGDGAGAFTEEVIALGHGVGDGRSFAVGDLNGDGFSDIVTSRYDGHLDGFEVLFQVGRVLECVGFEPPLNAGPVKVKRKRALPLKAQLADANGIPVTDAELSIPPVLQVIYSPATGGASQDVTDEALAVGLGTEGNQFEFNVDKWQYNLKTDNYTAPGTYTMTMTPGDGYIINPTCEATFVVN